MTTTNFDVLRQEQMLFDFKIRVDDKEFKAHKTVLAASSEYFRAMFRHEMIENRTNEMNLHDIDADTFGLILDFCYTSKLDLTRENVYDCLQAASFLQMELIKKICGSFLGEGVDENNCLAILIQARREGLDDLEETALPHCCAKFSDISHSQEFLDIDCDLLAKIIKDDRLRVEGEVEVLDAVERWIRADELRRKSRLDTLGPYIRFALFSSSQLIKSSTRDFILDSPVCSNLINLAIVLNAHPEQRDILSNKIDTRMRKAAIRSQEYLYMVGVREYHNGRKSSFAGKILEYDLRHSRWTELDIPEIAQFKACGFAKFKNSLYLVGGEGSGRFNLRIDATSRNIYRDVADRERGSRSLQVVADDGCLFAMGGLSSNHKTVNWMEKYDPSDNIWIRLPSMIHKRWMFGAVFYDGYIYVAGGLDTMINGACCPQVFRFKTHRNTWEYHSNMQVPRTNFDLCVCRDRIYAIGGNLNHFAEVFNEEEDEWEYIASPPNRNGHFKSLEHLGLIYSFNGSRLISYNPETNAWNDIADYAGFLKVSGIWANSLKT